MLLGGVLATSSGCGVSWTVLRTARRRGRDLFGRNRPQREVPRCARRAAL